MSLLLCRSPLLMDFADWSELRVTELRDLTKRSGEFCQVSIELAVSNGSASSLPLLNFDWNNGMSTSSKQVTGRRVEWSGPVDAESSERQIDSGVSISLSKPKDQSSSWPSQNLKNQPLFSSPAAQSNASPGVHRLLTILPTNEQAECEEFPPQNVRAGPNKKTSRQPDIQQDCVPTCSDSRSSSDLRLHHPAAQNTTITSNPMLSVRAAIDLATHYGTKNRKTKNSSPVTTGY
ncbi:hypothetical protein IRJ41_003779 [Triplophysa rosa]|uniref:Uncharacterized protein n=1 Tax=Triplophysa rosa TaxID=992332 RepID=A0A9W7WSB6_TRIRA|nr:hypothetical protein IRJ41_003779 [Triplophysa rosa]